MANKLYNCWLPESINALVFSVAVLLSGMMWAIRHIFSNSDLLFITSSFILLAFNLVSLSTSADACKSISLFYWHFQNPVKNQQIQGRLPTWSIISVERIPGSTISDSEDPRTEAILENLFLSSFGESIKFHSSKSEPTISFTYYIMKIHMNQSKFPPSGKSTHNSIQFTLRGHWFIKIALEKWKRNAWFQF